jgi:dipeptide/tripeptide permease
VAANVRRLRQLGLILCVAAPVARLIASWITVVLAERDGFSSGFPVAIPVDSMIAGLGVFVLAQVFAQGVALREEVEGTV